ncbi:MAG: hypothetical protein AAF797_07035 [Planctomycetota bacterium]
MATQAELITIKPRALTYGGDDYPGIQELSYTKNPPPTLPIRYEDELLPSGYESVQSDQDPINGSITSQSEATLETLADQVGGGNMTIGYKQAGTSNLRTKTFTGTFFRQGQGSITQVRLGVYRLNFVATAVSSAANA